MSAPRHTLPRVEATRLVMLLAVVVGPLCMVVVARQPAYGLLPIAALAMVALAWKSIAFPLGLAGFATPVVALMGSTPFPHGVVPVLESFWVVLAAVVLLMRRRASLPEQVLRSLPVVTTLALAVLLLARLPASADASYGSQKLQLYLLGNVVLLFAGVLLAQRREEIDLFLSLTLILDALSGLLILLGVGVDASTATNRVTLTGENAIALGAQGAQGLMVATYLLLQGRQRWMRTLAVALLPLTAFALFASGSRGPVIGGVVGELVILALLFRARARTARLLALAAVALVAAGGVAQFVPAQALSRSTSILTGSGKGYSSNGRDQLWSAAVSAFAEHPLVGIGTGSYPVVATEKACPGPGCLDRYPHNIVLELAAELGIVGLAVGLLFLGSSAAHVVRAFSAGAATHPEAVVVAGLFGGNLVTAMLTGDLSGHADLWLAAGLALGLSRLARLPAPGAEHGQSPATTRA